MNEMESEHRAEGGDSEASRLPTPSRQDIAWLLVGGGIVGGVVQLLRRRRSPLGWIAPVGLIGVGSAILLSERKTHMDTAELKIQAELDALDPVARAQVLKAVAQEQLGRLPGLGQ